MGGAERGLGQGESDSVPSSVEQGQGCLLHSSVETTEGSSRFIASPGPVPPPPTFISTPGAPCFLPMAQAPLTGPEKSTGALESRPLDLGLLDYCPNFWIWQEVD